MAFNNGFPATYQPAYYPYLQANQMPAGQTNGVIWVQGEAGAKSYLVAPNCTVQLWDSESPVIYLKSADASGMPSIKTLDYTVRETASPKKDMYATKADMESLASELRNEIKALKEAHNEPAA